MKITIATGPWLPVPAVRGGAIPRMWQGLAEEFVRRGHEVCIFARAFPGQPREELINGVRFVRWGGFSQGLSIKVDLAKDLVYATLAVWRLPRADILVTNDFWLPVLAGWFRARAGKVVVNANRFPKGQFRLYRRAARIAAASTAVRDAVVRECPALASRTAVIPNPIDATLLSPRATARDVGTKRTLLYVGRLHPEKGVHVLLEAFARIGARHPNWRLRVVGPVAEEQGGGGASYQQQLEALVAGMPVEFSGPVFDHRQLVEIYRAADLFCYPSLADLGEALPVAPIEAMACGLVPVVSAIECFRDYVVEGDTGFTFDHRGGDPVAALAARLDGIMAQPEQLESVSRRAVEMAARFSYPVVADQFLEDFAQLLRVT